MKMQKELRKFTVAIKDGNRPITPTTGRFGKYFIIDGFNVSYEKIDKYGYTLTQKTRKEIKELENAYNQSIKIADQIICAAEIAIQVYRAIDCLNNLSEKEKAFI